MEMILATKSRTPIIGQLASVMGWIMDGIYRLLDVCSEFRTSVFVSLSSVFLFMPYDTTADQTAEILQVKCDHAAGASEDPEEIQG